MKKPEIILLGQPNAGKSTVFNVLSDIKTHASNFSGTSIEKAESDIQINGRAFHIVDLPGVYSLNPGDEAEKVSYQYLNEENFDLIVNVVDASLLSRSLELTVELMEFGKPMVIALNMWDEAERKGLKVYPEKLQELLGIPVVVTSALYGKGITQLTEACYDKVFGKSVPPVTMEYTSHIEESVEKVEQKVEAVLASRETQLNGSPRFYAIKSIENPEALPADILDPIRDELKDIYRHIIDTHKKDCHETVSYERHHISMKLMEDISHFVDRKEIPLRERIDRYFLHPILGYFPLLIFFFLFFTAIYYTGNILGQVLEIPLGKIPPLYEGLKATHSFWWYSIDGVYQGLVGALGIVLPYFLPLIFLTSVFEDTGYLARMAFILDGFMHKIGLHGKSVAPFILGFGCTVPALYGVRIIENKRDRMLTAILLPFIPCSARTAVILALTAAFTGPLWTMFIYAFIVFVVAVTGKLLSFFIGRPTGLVMEIPDLKIPSFRVSLSKTWMKMKSFLSFAVPFLVLGSIAMGWLEYLKINDGINKVLAPIVKGVLGLPDVLGSTLVFGFFRKELVLVMANNAFNVTNLKALPLSAEEVIVFIIFVTLYFPCFSTFVVMWKEFGKKTVFLSSVVSLVVALAAAFAMRLILT
ncbi:MAG: ferrous iron transport protein B [bacterium]|nr:ferrous iron transport protein B [bacterium]